MEIKPKFVVGRKNKDALHPYPVPALGPYPPVWTPSVPTFLHRGVSAPVTPSSRETTCGIEGRSSRRAPDPALRTRDRDTPGPSARDLLLGTDRPGSPRSPSGWLVPGPPAEELLRESV